MCVVFCQNYSVLFSSRPSQSHQPVLLDARVSLLEFPPFFLIPAPFLRSVDEFVSDADVFLSLFLSDVSLNYRYRIDTRGRCALLC